VTDVDAMIRAAGGLRTLRVWPANFNVHLSSASNCPTALLTQLSHGHGAVPPAQLDRCCRRIVDRRARHLLAGWTPETPATEARETHEDSVNAAVLMLLMLLLLLLDMLVQLVCKAAKRMSNHLVALS
jgi:hypothetical protein